MDGAEARRALEPALAPALALRKVACLPYNMVEARAASVVAKAAPEAKNAVRVGAVRPEKKQSMISLEDVSLAEF